MAKICETSLANQCSLINLFRLIYITYFLGKTSTNSKPVHATLWNAFGQYAKDLHEGYVPFQYQHFQSGNSCEFSEH